MLPLAACSGEQGERAQQLLDRAQVAHSRLTSLTYDMRMTFAVDGQRFSLLMDGGGYQQGPQAGNQVLTMRTEGLPGGMAFSMHMVMRGRRVTLTANGHTASLTVPPSARQQYDWSGAMLELARYVNHVKVREGRIVNGEGGATVAGVIDTEGLLKAASKLEAFAQASGSAAPRMEELAERFGDTRAALFIATRSGLIRSAVIGVPIDAEGTKGRVDVTYRLTSVNRTIPGL